MKRKKRSRPKRVTWSIICGIIVVISVVLVFLFSLPRDSDRGATSKAPGSNNITTISQIGLPPLPTATPFTPGSYTSINSRLFSNKSPWNVPIGNNVRLDPNSSAMARQLSDCCHVPAMFDFGMPIYTSTASDPTYNVQDNGNDNTFQSRQPIHIPNDAAPSPGSDHWLFIYDKTKNMIFEMWQAEKQGGTWSTNTGNVYSPTGDGVLQVDGSQQSGNGASYFGGVITDADIQRGSINHALSLASEYTASTWRYPMNASDGQGTSSSDIPMGARLQLDPSVNCKTLPGASKGEKMVCQAMETYGGYMRDSGGVALSMYFEGESLNDPNRNPPDGSPGDPGRAGAIFGNIGLRDSKDLPDIPWNKLRVLKAWNSFTAPATTSSPVASAQPALPNALSARLTSPYTTPDLPIAPYLASNETAGKRRWQMSL